MRISKSIDRDINSRETNSQLKLPKIEKTNIFTINEKQKEESEDEDYDKKKHDFLKKR